MKYLLIAFIALAMVGCGKVSMSEWKQMNSWNVYQNAYHISKYDIQAFHDYEMINGDKYDKAKMLTLVELWHLAQTNENMTPAEIKSLASASFRKHLFQ